MPMKWVPVRGQKFDIGRTINPMKCSSCQKCDFMNCKNYAVRTKLGRYTMEEFVSFHQNDLAGDWADDLVDDFLSSVAPSSPKGLYWEASKNWRGDAIEKLRFVTMSQRGKERTVGSISMSSFHVFDEDLSETNKKFLLRVAKLMSDTNDALWAPKQESA